MKPWQLIPAIILVLVVGLGGNASLMGAEDAQARALDAFKGWLAMPGEERPDLSSQAFAREPLDEEAARTSHDLLWDTLADESRAERRAEIEAKEIVRDGKTLRFEFKTFGPRPEGGHSLYLSLHGGGGTRPEINDRQWRNQIGLYEPEEGVYLAPRAPTDTWNLWHQGHIDGLFDRLVENFVILGEVNPNKVYLMGYSAGGDGVYQLAPRWADRLAAAAMMAGHPNEARPDGLRNLGFTLHMGGEDAAFKRNAVAREWKTLLKSLHEADPGGYAHHVEIHEGKGHWMEREDAVAVRWMAKFTREAHPDRVVWLQDDVTHDRFYWLSVAREDAVKGQKLVASVGGQTVTIEEAEGLGQCGLLLTDALIDLDEEIRVLHQGRAVYSGKVPRTLRAIAKHLTGRMDPTLFYWSELEVQLQP